MENAEIARAMTVVGGSLVRRFALDAQLTWVVGVVGPARVKLKFNVRLGRSDFLRTLLTELAFQTAHFGTDRRKRIFERMSQFLI